MWTFLWLAVTTGCGWAIGVYGPFDAIHPYIGSGIGFVVGGVLRLMVAIGGGEAIEAVGDVVGAIFD